VPLTQDIVTNTVTERMDALRNDLKTANADGNFGCAVAFCDRLFLSEPAAASGDCRPAGRTTT
jgi:hypothetical protein